MARADFSTGEALVGLLEAYGVETIFGIPGVHNVEMYRALPRSKIRHVLTRHEQGAGFMADGYARVSGKPGVCFTITGPGLTNIMTPLGQAWSDSSPVLVISSALDIKDAAQGRGRLHEMKSQIEAARAVTALARIAYTPADVQDFLAEAFAHFSAHRARPAYLEIPIDVLKKPAGEDWAARRLPQRARPHPHDIAEAAALLAKAQRPVIILGGGAAEAGSEAAGLAERLGAAIVETTAGKGSVSETHPLCLGSRLARPGIKDRLKAADLVLAVGTELAETDFWDEQFSFAAALIRIDLDPSSLARPHPASLAILGDAKPTLAAILEALGASAGRWEPAAAEVAGYLRQEPEGDDDLRAMLRKVLHVIRSALPPETIFSADSTQIAYASNEIFPMQAPRTWLYPVGFGTLGFALPAAIGAQFAKPATPVAVLAGDYGFQYTVNELGTAAEHKLPLIILLWNNDALAQIRDDMVTKGIQPNAVSLVNPDFQMLAKAYACHAERPSSLAALARAIATALKADRPSLIEIGPRMAHG